MAPHTYASAGVDIDAADRAKARIKRLARATFPRTQRTGKVLTEIGGFGGLYQLPRGLRRPVLVSSADGVGTKLKVAIAMGVHNTVGRDLVNHCVNDILVQGAAPLFFLDYIAIGRMAPATVASLVEGLSRGCRENGCALIGGETAEMPGLYAEGDYDLAGTIVGLVERDALITGGAIRAGDLLLGLRSAGLHTNGYALARMLLLDTAGYRLSTRVKALQATVGEALLAEHRSYLPLLRPILKRLAGLAHITGGGLPGNLPRILPADCAAEIQLSSWEIPPLFRLLERIGDLPADDLRRTFNLGIGMVLVVAPKQKATVLRHLRGAGEDPVEMGRIVARRRAGRRKIVFLP